MLTGPMLKGTVLQLPLLVGTVAQIEAVPEVVGKMPSHSYAVAYVPHLVGYVLPFTALALPPWKYRSVSEHTARWWTRGSSGPG